MTITRVFELADEVTVVLTDYNGTWDEFFAHRLLSDDQVQVSHDVRTEGGILYVVRVVTKQAHRRKDQVILWESVVLAVPTVAGADLIRDLASGLYVSDK